MYQDVLTIRTITSKLFWILVLAAGFLSSEAQTQVLTNPEVVLPVAMAISQPMRDLPLSTGTEKTGWKDGIIPLLSPADFKRKDIDVEKDGSLKNYEGPFGVSAIIQNFDGVPFNPALLLSPPDPSGDVGPNHYVQMVNLRTQIWNKSGVSLAGPVNNSTFWAALGPPFSTTNSGDPIVLYDDMADRWIITQFCLPSAGAPFYQLIAVSTTADPTGTYYQYAYSFSNFPDYPKFGVWPDGYYMSANAFSPPSFPFVGTYAVVFDRNTMLTGGVAPMQFSLISAPTWSLLPSDCDGIPPPSGSPNYFLGTYNSSGGGNTDLDIYQFHVDWLNPIFSTFTGPLLLTTPAFNIISATRQDIPQPGTTVKLDGMDNRPMNRLQYRNFGSHQAMVVCQTVDAGGLRAGIRWWELRKTSGNWSIYQEGTHAPADELFRWMGSIAMDANGTIALGYSTSGLLSYPAIRYTGRLAIDPLGFMTFAEAVIQAGGGAQLSSGNRWGDYTQMTVDPSVDGTFWYTNEYYEFTSSANWKTRIAAFKFEITTLGIKVIPEGFYNVGLNRLNMKDTVRAYLRYAFSNPPTYQVIDSAKSVIDSITFSGDFKFLYAPSGTYYLTIKHRNSIETWSKLGGEGIVKGSTSSYDFTNAQNKAYGNNMKLKGTKWCIYSGDVNQDGIVDLSDLSLVDNDNLIFQTGYRATDLNGDSIIDLSDLQIVDINNIAFVSKQTP